MTTHAKSDQINTTNLVDYTQQQVLQQPEKIAFIFLADGEVEKNKLSNFQLDLKSKAIAAELQKQAKWGDRVLLSYLPGIEFITAFMGCLYAGMIAVPAYPLRSNHHAKRFLAMLEDCQPALILGTTESLTMMQEQTEFAHYHYIYTDTLSDELAVTYQKPQITPDTLAFLQYTSGSTGVPKGVMVCQRNIMSNLQAIDHVFGLPANEKMVSWLPMQHDMGLIGQVLYVIYTGATEIFMSPTAFLEKPVRLLQAINHYRAFGSGGPNFGYQLCLEKVTDEELHGMDLSCWTEAFNGSEPIRASTLQQFVKRFAPWGIKESIFMPCYGMAETTLLVSGKSRETPLIITSIDKNELTKGVFEKKHDSNELLVSSGYVYPEYTVKIVNPTTVQLANPGEIGEIWVHGASVACGYWNKPEISKQTFAAKLPNDPNNYLRTGDLGYLDGKELYITGRLKDIIILQGRNIYPQDIEAAVEACHPAIRSGCTAAFSVDIDAQEQLIVVAEIERTYRKVGCKPIFLAMRQALVDAAEAVPYSIQLLAPAKALRTTSGKIQRQATKKAYLANELTIVAKDDLYIIAPSEPTLEELENGISTLLAKVLAVESVANNQPFSQLGGTSLHAVLFQQQLLRYIGNRVEISPTIALDYPTVRQLAGYIHQQLTGKGQEKDQEIIVNTIPQLNEPIAIVGMACRFPGGANTPEDFWQLLQQGKEAIDLIPETRWSLDDYYDPNPDTPNKTPVRHGAFIDDIDLFDAKFFNISPREAENMDPQQRLLLEVVWESLENAGINPKELAETDTSVFIGATTHEYSDLLSRHNYDAYIATGNNQSVLAGRISFALGLQGPCLTLDTACSSSLVALNQACHSLHLGETHLAIVGGVNALLSPYTYITLSNAKMLTTDGHCKVFSEQADGYVRGEGCGVVVLKRLSDARQAGDKILGVIKSSVVNQDGASSGLTVPNGVAQEKLLRKSLAQANLQPKDIDYIEAHGTGTKLGDPMETHAISNVYKNSHDEQNPLYISSVKANIGHLESAAGMASLIKTVLALQYEKIPPHVPFKKLNSAINLTAIPAQIPLELTDWKKGEKPRRAGISSFGFSGTNAHVILEEAPQLDYMPRASLPPTIFNRQRYWAPIINDVLSMLGNNSHPLTHQDNRELSTNITNLLNSFLGDMLAAGRIEQEQYVTLESLLDELITAHLKEVLHLDKNQQIDKQAGFFELGMDSITAMELTKRIQNSFNNELVFSDALIFDNPSIENLARYLLQQIVERLGSFETSTEGLTPKNYDIVPYDKPFSLNHRELRFWIARKNLAPVVGLRLSIAGKIDLALFKTALSYVIKNQPMLWREIDKNIPLQKRIYSTDNLDFQIISMQSKSVDPAKAFEIAIDECFFDFTPPLIKVRVYQYSDTKYELAVFMPHIACDAYSFGVLFSEVNHCYSAFQAGKEPPIISTEYRILKNPPDELSVEDYQQLFNVNLKDAYQYEDLYLPVLAKNIDIVGGDYCLPINEARLKTQLISKYNVSAATIFMTAMTLTVARLFAVRSMTILMLDAARDSSNIMLVGGFEKYLYLNIKVKNGSIREYVDYINGVRQEMLTRDKYKNIVHLGNYMFKHIGFKGVWKWGVNALYRRESKGKLGAFYKGGDIYSIIDVLLLALMRKMREKFNNLLAKLGFHRKTDILFALNYTPLPVINTIANCEVNLIDKYKLAEKLGIGWGANMLLYKNPTGEFEYKLVGRNVTKEFRDRYAETFSEIIDELQKDENRSIKDLL